MSRKILVVDDEKDIVEMLKYNLEKSGYSVMIAHHGKEALEKAQKHPDLILLDVMMPEMDGWEVCRQIKRDEKTSDIPVLFLTAKGGETDEVVGLELGADDYVVKPIALAKLLARIRSVLRRKESVEARPRDKASVIRIEGLEINALSYEVKVALKKIAFPKKEFETLHYLASHRGRVISREKLLNAIWGENVYVVDRTVDVHIRKIREKLGKYGEYIETVKGVGYRFRD